MLKKLNQFQISHGLYKYVKIKPGPLLSHVFGTCSKYPRENNEIHTIYKYIKPVHPSRELTGGKGSGVCEEGVWVNYEPSNVMLLVICSETRGEILLRCHCSVSL